MDAFGVRNKVIGDYRSFVQSFVEIADDRVRETVENEIASGLLWPEPWLALNPTFQSGGTITQLVRDNVLHPACEAIFRRDGQPLTLHQHQRDAVEIAAQGRSYVLTTGTGSGKSLSYIVPIVDRVLREGSGQGVQALIVYPMNALANSQVGELEKFLGTEKPAVTFQRYTGQEDRKTREAILADPPEILLTNYVMLELLLTRPNERKALIGSAKNLRFLVLDELHTYRGRQGADVAMLLRRLRSAVDEQDLQCVGTSATLAGPGTRAEQRTEVAALASRLFGTEIRGEDVVGETLRRATDGELDPAALAALEPAALDVWIEQQLGLDVDDEGKLSRRRPQRLHEVAQELFRVAGISNAQELLQKQLLSGADRGTFAFKLHQFIGKGDTAYVTLEPPETRYTTTTYQRSAPELPLGRPLFPLAFCRECGQDFLMVTLKKESFEPRPQTGQVEEEGSKAVLMLRSEPWPDEDDAALLDLVPEDWLVEHQGARIFDRTRRNRLPRRVQVDAFGTIVEGPGELPGDGIEAALFETLHFCPTCRTSYESTRQSEFSRLASLGTEGRASAVTVLSQSVVRALRSAGDVAEDEKKFLAFSDNRQDASLQAGNFNDFVLVGLIRAAVLRAVRGWSEKHDEPLSDEDLGRAVVEALGLPIETYSSAPDADYGALKKVKRALRDAVSYRVYADLERGWKITMPNLEQTGQLRLTYDSLRQVAEAEQRWADDKVLSLATPDERFQVLHVLLDEMRRHLAVQTDYSARSATTRSSAPRPSGSRRRGR